MGKIRIFIGLSNFLMWFFLYYTWGKGALTILSQLSPDLAPHIHKEGSLPRIVLRFFGRNVQSL